MSQAGQGVIKDNNHTDSGQSYMLPVVGTWSLHLRMTGEGAEFSKCTCQRAQVDSACQSHLQHGSPIAVKLLADALRWVTPARLH